jgi:hypothetical protein
MQEYYLVFCNLIRGSVEIKETDPLIKNTIGKSNLSAIMLAINIARAPLYPIAM